MEYFSFRLKDSRQKKRWSLCFEVTRKHFGIWWVSRQKLSNKASTFFDSIACKVIVQKFYEIISFEAGIPFIGFGNIIFLLTKDNLHLKVFWTTFSWYFGAKPSNINLEVSPAIVFDDLIYNRVEFMVFPSWLQRLLETLFQTAGASFVQSTLNMWRGGLTVSKLFCLNTVLPICGKNTE